MIPIFFKNENDAGVAGQSGRKKRKRKKRLIKWYDFWDDFKSNKKKDLYDSAFLKNSNLKKINLPDKTLKAWSKNQHLLTKTHEIDVRNFFRCSLRPTWYAIPLKKNKCEAYSVLTQDENNPPCNTFPLEYHLIVFFS